MKALSDDKYLGARTAPKSNEHHESTFQSRWLLMREHSKWALAAFVRIVWDISTWIRAPELLFWWNGSHFSSDRCARKKGIHEYSFNQAGSKLISIFLHFSDPASHMIPDIVHYIKSGWLMLKLDQLRWYLTKVGARKMANIRYLMGSLCGQNKIPTMTPREAGGWLVRATSYQQCSQKRCFIRYKCNSAYYTHPLNQIVP